MNKIIIIIMISSLSVVSKILERHMHSVIIAHLCESNDAQWGFTPGRSTITALLSTFHEILKHLQSGVDVALTFFDLRKAFDSVPHRLLLKN